MFKPPHPIPLSCAAPLDPLHPGHDARRRLQLERCCTGLDTGCLYGGELTAVVLPPLSQLRAGGASAQTAPAAQAAGKPQQQEQQGGDEGTPSAFEAKLAAGLPITREDLHAQLVSVPAARVYAQPKRKAAPADEQQQEQLQQDASSGCDSEAEAALGGVGAADKLSKVGASVRDIVYTAA